jgi:hypothetical protein
MGFQPRAEVNLYTVLVLARDVRRRTNPAIRSLGVTKIPATDAHDDTAYTGKTAIPFRNAHTAPPVPALCSIPVYSMRGQAGRASRPREGGCFSGNGPFPPIDRAEPESSAALRPALH